VLGRCVMTDSVSSAVSSSILVSSPGLLVLRRSVLCRCNARKAQFDATVGVHPTAAEELVTMRTRTRRVKGRGGEANGSRDHQNRNAE